MQDNKPAGPDGIRRKSPYLSYVLEGQVELPGSLFRGLTCFAINRLSACATPFVELQQFCNHYDIEAAFIV